MSNQLHTVAAAESYGLPKPQIDANGTTATALATGIANVAAAKAAYHGAMQAWDANVSACAEAVAVAARTMYANPAVRPAMISAAGLAPRSTSRTKIVPKTPIELTATPRANGDFTLKWNRFGNARGVNFVVEAQTGTGDWLYVGDTTAAKMTLSGYAPGMPVSFRVSASKNGTTTAPSSLVTIYPAAVTPALRLAAYFSTPKACSRKRSLRWKLVRRLRLRLQTLRV